MMKYLLAGVPIVFGIVDMAITHPADIMMGSDRMWESYVCATSAILLGLIALKMVLQGRLLGLPLLALAVYNSIAFIGLIYAYIVSQQGDPVKTGTLLDSMAVSYVLIYTKYLVPSLLVVLGGMKLVGKFNQFTY